MLIFFYLREKITDSFRDYSFLLSEVTYKAKYGKRLKTSTPKQMLQILPIALAQVKAGNTSENILTEIRQINIFCIEKKKVPKKYITI